MIYEEDLNELLANYISLKLLSLDPTALMKLILGQRNKKAYYDGQRCSTSES